MHILEVVYQVLVFVMISCVALFAVISLVALVASVIGIVAGLFGRG